MKKIIRFLIHFGIVIVGVVAFYCIYSRYLDNKIERLYPTVERTVNHVSGLGEKDKGKVLIEQSMKNSDMFIMGSSELASGVPENPKNFLPNDIYGDASFVGHASVQNLLHAINLGANDKAVDNRDIVIVESLQWFTGSDIGTGGFFSNFSELQFYECLHNDRISEKNKEYLCNRYIELENSNAKSIYTKIDNFAAGNAGLEFVNKCTFGVLKRFGFGLVEGELTFPQTYIYARMYVADNPIEKAIQVIIQPYYWLRYKFLLLKDKYDSYQWLCTLKPEGSREQVVLNWAKIYSDAEAEGRKACTNNDMAVSDTYYTKYLEPKWEQLKDRDIQVPLMESKEWEDYQFFLDLCSELGLRPFIVAMSTNGWYYDYIGMDKTKRDALYNRIEEMASEHGMNCLNLKDKEYEPYFYCDVMHLGWKGWPYVLQKTLEHFTETSY